MLHYKGWDIPTIEEAYKNREDDKSGVSSPALYITVTNEVFGSTTLNAMVTVEEVAKAYEVLSGDNLYKRLGYLNDLWFTCVVMFINMKYLMIKEKKEPESEEYRYIADHECIKRDWRITDSYRNGLNSWMYDHEDLLKELGYQIPEDGVKFGDITVNGEKYTILDC